MPETPLALTAAQARAIGGYGEHGGYVYITPLDDWSLITVRFTDPELKQGSDVTMRAVVLNRAGDEVQV